MHFLELSFQREKLELLSPNIMSHSIFWQLFGLKASSTTTSDVVGWIYRFISICMYLLKPSKTKI